MNTFDESKVRRATDGKFARKNHAEGDVSLHEEFLNQKKEYEDSIVSRVDSGMVTAEELRYSVSAGELSYRFYKKLLKRDPISHNLLDSARSRGWFDDDTGFDTEAMWDEFTSDSRVEADPESPVDEDDGKTYVRAFSAPIESHANYSMSGYEDLSNYNSVAAGKTDIRIGEGHARLGHEGVMDWVEVPVLDRFGKPTEDAVVLANLLEDTSEFYIVNEEDYFERERERERESIVRTLEGFERGHYKDDDVVLEDFDSLKDDPDVLYAVHFYLSEGNAFGDHGTYVNEDDVAEAWNEVVRQRREIATEDL